MGGWGGGGEVQFDDGDDERNHNPDFQEFGALGLHPDTRSASLCHNGKHHYALHHCHPSFKACQCKTKHNSSASQVRLEK